MADILNPLAPHALPFFITPPGQTDILMVITAIFMVAVILSIGLLYLHLHSIPERMMHRRANKTQFEIVAVLALLALFTHINLFWVTALLLAMITVPDFSTPIGSIAESLRRLADRGDPPEPPAEPEPEAPTVQEEKGGLSDV